MTAAVVMVSAVALGLVGLLGTALVFAVRLHGELADARRRILTLSRELWQQPIQDARETIEQLEDQNAREKRAREAVEKQHDQALESLDDDGVADAFNDTMSDMATMPETPRALTTGRPKKD